MALAADRRTVEGLEVRSRAPLRPSGRPPLLFVHGAAHGAWCWDEHWMPAAAARGWPCHALSVRGHGASRGAGTRLWTERIDDYLDDVLQVVVSLPRPPVLVGHSMGGLIVARILARYPAPAAVLVAPIGLRHGLGFAWRLVRRHPLVYLRSAARNPPPLPADYLFSALDDEAARAYAARMIPESVAALLELQGLRRPPGPTPAPVLVLGGGDDAVIPAVDVVRAARRYGTRARFFPGMGHDLMLERGWQAPLDIVLRWLEVTLDG